MPPTSSFDVTTGVDLQEVDNAVNQAQKEIAQRYDFKGSPAAIEFKRAEESIDLVAASDFQMRALFDVLQSKLIKRGVSVKREDGPFRPAHARRAGRSCGTGRLHDRLSLFVRSGAAVSAGDAARIGEAPPQRGLDRIEGVALGRRAR